MKIKKLLAAITTSIAFILGFTACIEGGGKYNYSYLSPAVVEHNLQAGTILRTAYGNFVPDNVSDLSLAGLSSGSCIYMGFEYDSEYQTGQYPVASNIKHEVTGYNSLVVNIPEQTQEIIDSYNYPLLSVDLFNESLSPNYQGRFFVVTKAKLDKNQELGYYFYYNSDEQPDATGTRNVYLQAQLPVTSGGTQEITDMLALDVRDLTRSSGRDTTILDGSISYSLVYLKVNLKYCSGLEDGNLVYKSASTQPIYIYTYRDDL
ncbi:MAG: hypothetical protein LBR97_01795 [Dysgonamonadaceae bacterium]|jgi:hypothetical protein|nr:hypothetical protein [Dysgonamonadaceae bacterium]